MKNKSNLSLCRWLMATGIFMLCSFPHSILTFLKSIHMHYVDKCKLTSFIIDMIVIRVQSLYVADPLDLLTLLLIPQWGRHFWFVV